MNVALVDEHPVFRTAVRTMLKNQFDVIAMQETASIQSLEMLLQQDIFDIVIIGLSEEHPELDPSVLKKVMKRNPLTSFIVYASGPDHKLARSLLRIGVKGYVTKHACPEELVSCVRSVVMGKPYVSSEVLVSILARKKPPGTAKTQHNKSHI